MSRIRRAAIAITALALLAIFAGCSVPPQSAPAASQMSTRNPAAAVFPVSAQYTGTMLDHYTDGSVQARPVAITLPCTAFFVSSDNDALATDHCTGMTRGTALLNDKPDPCPECMSGIDDDSNTSPAPQAYSDGTKPAGTFMYSSEVIGIERSILGMPTNTPGQIFDVPTPLRFRGSIPTADGDLALLHWDSADAYVPSPYAELALSQAKIGDTVTMIGFSLDQINNSAPYGLRGAPIELLFGQVQMSRFFNQGVVSNRVTDSNGVMNVTMSTPAYPMMSGSPVVDTNNRVVLFVKTVENGVTNMGDITIIRELLAQYDVVLPPATDTSAASSDQDFQPAGSATPLPSNEDNDNNDPVFKFIVVICLLVIIALMAFNAYRQRIDSTNLTYGFRATGDRIREFMTTYTLGRDNLQSSVTGIHDIVRRRASRQETPVEETPRDVTSIRPDRPEGQ